jgi:hypothetical protein
MLALLAAFAVLAGSLAFGAAVSRAAGPKQELAAKSAAESKSKNLTRQFTGWVTAADKTSLTVEKRGKKPRTVVFARHAEMKTTGEIGKDAHVTVYYRDEGGQSVAHRVVAKPTGSR